MNKQLLHDLVQSIENRKQTEQRLRATVRPAWHFTSLAEVLIALNRAHGTSVAHLSLLSPWRALRLHFRRRLAANFASAVRLYLVLCLCMP